MEKFDIYLKKQYENLDGDKKVAKEYLALVMLQLVKSKNNSCYEIIDDDIKKTLLEHEDRIKKFIIKDTIISFLTSIVLLFFGVYIKCEYWYIWIVLSIIFFGFETYIQRMTMDTRFNKKFQDALELEIDKDVIEYINKKL